jgi:predicted glutamine amidotransferase
MCGIVGVIKKANYGFYKKQQDSFFQMLYADAVRGWDSTGVVGVERDGSFHIAKEALEAAYVIPQIKVEKFYNDRMDKAEGKVWIGHNRKTTVGKTNDENAHPFVINNEFAFVHNGTLFNHEQLAKTDVDSKALAIVLHEALGEKDWKKALEDTLGKVYGAYACAWFDQRHNKLFLLRNKERPLIVAETDDAYYWASESAMMYWVLNRNDYKHDDIKFHKMEENVLFSFDLTDTKMEVEELKPKKSTPPVLFRTGGRMSTADGTVFTSSQSAGGHSSSDMSKNQLKALRRTWLGRPLRFWVDDYVERDFQSGVSLEDGAISYILGDTEIFNTKNAVTALIDPKKLSLTSPKMVVDRPWIGHIENMYWDKQSKELKIWVLEPKPIASSISSIAGMSAALEKYVKEKQTEYEKTFGPLKQVMQDGKIQLRTTDKQEKIVYETPITLH